MPDPALADPSITDVALGVVGKVGYTVASILGLLYVLKWLSGIHLQALKDRIIALEGELKHRDERIAAGQGEISALHREMLDRSEAHAKVLHDLALKVITAIEKQAAYTKQLAHALDDRPCPFNPNAGSPPTSPLQHRTPLPVPPAVSSDRIPA